MTKNEKHELRKIANLVNCFKREEAIARKIKLLNWEEKIKRYGSIESAWDNARIIDKVADHTFHKALDRAYTDADWELALIVMNTRFIDKCIKAYEQ